MSEADLALAVLDALASGEALPLTRLARRLGVTLPVLLRVVHVLSDDAGLVEVRVLRPGSPVRLARLTEAGRRLLDQPNSC